VAGEQHGYQGLDLNNPHTSPADCVVMPAYLPLQLPKEQKRRAMVWFGLVWFGLVWFGLVWFGLVWFGLVWKAASLSVGVLALVQRIEDHFPRFLNSCGACVMTIAAQQHLHRRYTLDGEAATNDHGEEDLGGPRVVRPDKFGTRCIQPAMPRRRKSKINSDPYKQSKHHDRPYLPGALGRCVFADRLGLSGADASTGTAPAGGGLGASFAV
jgi:hypothetical protein